MTIVVAYKWAANPQDASVGADSTVDWSRAKASVSEYDPIAIQVARNLADANGAEVVGVSVGTPDVASSMAKKAAMSRGLDRGLVATDDAASGWNLTETAGALAALVRRVGGADIVLTGDASIDQNAKMVPAILAGYLGWPAFQGVTAVEKSADGWLLTQAVTGGTRTIKVAGPVVVSVTADAVQAKVPGMKDILAAGKKAVDQVPAADLGVTRTSVEVTSRTKPAQQSRKHQKFAGASAAADLVAAMRADGVL